MPLALHKRLQQPKPEVPRRRDLLNQMSAQRTAKIRIHRGRQVNADFAQALGADAFAFLPAHLSPDLIQFASQHIVVRLQRIQHIPNRFEVARLDCACRILASGYEHRQHNRARLLVRAEANGATDGLDDVHLAAARVDKRHAIERGHVHAFGQAARITQHASFVCAQPFELVELDLAFVGGHVAGDEVGAQGSAGAMFVADPLHRLLNVCSEGFGAVDAAVEADDALEVVVLDGFEQADLGGERFAVGLAGRVYRLRLLMRVVSTPPIPAFPRLRGKGRMGRCARLCFSASVQGDQFAVGDPLRDGGVVHADDDDAVIGEQFALDGFAERQGIQHFAKQGGVVHADDFDAAIFGGFMDGAGVGARGGGGE